MEKIKKLHAYLDSKSVSDLKSDIEFYTTVQQVENFLNRIDKLEAIRLLDNEQKEKIFKIIDEIHSYAESYVANKSNSLCLAINHFVIQGYNILFSQINNFEMKFGEILAECSKKITELESSLQLREAEFSSVINTLNISNEKADTIVKNIEGQLKNALEIVNGWINNVQKETDKQITAKRNHIDIEITNYKNEVKENFNDVLKDFQRFKEDQIQEFEKIDKRRKEFVEMYEIGVKYSKEARFDEYSAKEKQIADIFRWLSLGLMILVIVFIATITLAGNNIHEWYSTLSRFLLVFSLMIPAVYTSRESSRHRRNSDKYAQMANELKAFEIAIRTEDMKPEIKDRIKEEIFKRYFGNIFANNNIDKTFSDDMGIFGKVLRPEQKVKRDK